MNTLIFHIKGSAKEPYRIIAEGAGQQFRAFCSCPAGRKGGKFCKHVSYLLHGDIGKLVSPAAADVSELARRAEGSPLLVEAGVRIEKDMKIAEAVGYKSLAEVFDAFRSEMEELGWVAVLVEHDGERDEDRFELYATFKKGGMRKRPSIVLELVRKDYDADLGSLSGGFEWGSDPVERLSLSPRERPLGVRTTGGKSVGKTWKHLPEAVTVFLDLARRGPAAKL